MGRDDVAANATSAGHGTASPPGPHAAPPAPEPSLPPAPLSSDHPPPPPDTHTSSMLSSFCSASSISNSTSCNVVALPGAVSMMLPKPGLGALLAPGQPPVPASHREQPALLPTARLCVS